MTAQGRTIATADAPEDVAAALRAALLELVRLKDIKTQHGETADYRDRRERAWSEARRVLALPASDPGPTP